MFLAPGVVPQGDMVSGQTTGNSSTLQITCCLQLKVILNQEQHLQPQ